MAWLGCATLYLHFFYIFCEFLLITSVLITFERYFRLFSNSLGLADMEVQTMLLLMRRNSSSIRNSRSFIYQHVLARLSSPSIAYLSAHCSIHLLMNANIIFSALSKGYCSWCRRIYCHGIQASWDRWVSRSFDIILL